MQGVIEYALALFFNKLVSYTFLFWLPFYVKQSRESHSHIRKYGSTFYIGIAMVVLPYFGPWEN